MFVWCCEMGSEMSPVPQEDMSPYCVGTNSDY